MQLQQEVIRAQTAPEVGLCGLQGVLTQAGQLPAHARQQPCDPLIGRTQAAGCQQCSVIRLRHVQVVAANELLYLRSKVAFGSDGNI